MKTLLEKAFSFTPGLALLIGISIFLAGCTRETPDQMAKPKGPKHWNKEFAMAISRSF